MGLPSDFVRKGLLLRGTSALSSASAATPGPNAVMVMYATDFLMRMMRDCLPNFPDAGTRWLGMFRLDARPESLGARNGLGWPRTPEGRFCESWRVLGGLPAPAFDR